MSVKMQAKEISRTTMLMMTMMMMTMCQLLIAVPVSGVGTGSTWACEFTSLQLMGFLYYSAAAAAGIVVLLVCIDRFKKKYALQHIRR